MQCVFYFFQKKNMENLIVTGVNFCCSFHLSTSSLRMKKSSCQCDLLFNHWWCTWTRRSSLSTFLLFFFYFLHARNLIYVVVVVRWVNFKRIDYTFVFIAQQIFIDFPRFLNIVNFQRLKKKEKWGRNLVYKVSFFYFVFMIETTANFFWKSK